MGIPMKSYSKNDTKFKKFLNKVKDEFKDLFSPQMELACAGVPIKIPLDEMEDEKTKNLIFFHTGSYPKNGTIERDIMEKKEVRILDKSEDIQFRDIDAIITPVDAQKELYRILNSKKASHEYIAYEATKMFNDEEITRYTLHIVAGAKAEDYNFMPGETLDDLFVEKPKKKYKDDMEFARERNISNTDKSVLKRLFRWISKMAELFTSTIEHDVINRPYMSHFFDKRRGEGDRGLNVNCDDIKFKSALSRAQKLWVLALESYKKGEKSKAYTYLGHFLHLVGDMHIPAHVHNDIHAPWPIDKKDSYEEWCGRSDYDHLRRPEDKLNISIWKSSFLKKPENPMSWKLPSDKYDGTTKESIDSFFETICGKTQMFRTVDFPGVADSQKKVGKLSDDECFEQAEVLIPRAISNTAQVIENFRYAIDEYKKI